MCFVVIFSAFFLGFSGRVCSVVGASVFAATIYRCGARHSHRCNLPDHIPSSLRSSYSFLRFIFADHLFALHSRRPSFLHHKRSRSPKHRRGESEWIPRSTLLMDSPTFSTSRSTCLDDLQLPVRIMTSTLLAVYFASCSIANHEHPRMAFISAASFSALHSSFRYLRSLYSIS